jgi:hypothetical protein
MSLCELSRLYLFVHSVTVTDQMSVEFFFSCSIQQLYDGVGGLCRFAIKKWEHLVQDFEQLITKVVEPWRQANSPSLPLFFTGASMGGLVVCLSLNTLSVVPPDLLQQT